MAITRTVEVFSAGCPACEEVVRLVTRMACPSCALSVVDMREPAVAVRARQLGIRSIPAVVVDGILASCCTVAGPDEARLRASGVGRPI